MRPTEDGQSFLLLLDAIDVFESERIPYAVIGAVAASFYGVVRASLGADAIFSLAADSLESLEGVFQKRGFRTSLRRGTADDPISAVLELTDSFGNRVDLLAGIRGQDPDLFSRAVETKFHSHSLRMVGLEDFIAMKLYAGSYQDLADARSAVEISGHALDRNLLQRLTARFGKESVNHLKEILP